MFERSRDRIEMLRPWMVSEYVNDLDVTDRYRSKRLTEEGWRRLPELALEACESRDEIWLRRQLEPLIVQHEVTARGLRRVNAAASAEMIADGLINNLICRAECLSALESGNQKVEIFRAGRRRQPRADSAWLIGQRFDPETLLEALRSGAIDPIGNQSPIPVGLNSGLSVRAVETLEEGR